MSKKFGERIRELQEKKGVDDEYTADYLGIPIQKYRDSLNGKKPFFYDDIRLLENLFNIKMGRLVDEYMNVPTTKEPESKDEDVMDETEIEPEDTESIDTILDEEEQKQEPEIKEERKKMKGTRRKKRDSGYGIRDMGFEKSGSGYGTREVRHETRDSRHESEEGSQGQEETIMITSIQIPEYDPTIEEEVKTTIGTILKQCREIRGLRIQDISEKISTSKSTWSAYENGINIPTPETIKEITKILNADKKLFKQLYDEIHNIHVNIQQEKNKETREKREKTMYDTIESFIRNKGDIEKTAKEFQLDRSMIQKRLAKIFEEEPALEYIVYDSLDEDVPIKKKGTFERANKRKLYETIQQKYHPNMTGEEKVALAQNAGYKSWFSLQRAIEVRKKTIEQIIKEKIPEKPFKEYSCKWPREEKTRQNL